MEFKKIAFFVEGFTELEFLKNLLIEVFGQKQIAVEIGKIKGGNKIRITHTTISTPTITDETKYYILIYDCGGDNRIKSYILERRENLIKAGYTKIIGIRDVYPDVKRDEIELLRRGMYYKIPQKDIPISFILSTMEVESWFLAEDQHYTKINKSLTNKEIEDNFSFNPESYNTEMFDEPAQKLNDIYSLAGETYEKTKVSLSRTISSLDFCNIYFNVNKRIASLKELTDEIDSLFN